MNVQEIPLFFTIDDAYAPYLAVALRSAVDNANPMRRYRAIILYQQLDEDNRTRLAALAAPHFSVEFVPMAGELDAITDRMGNRLRCDYFTLTIYFRLFIPAMFPQYDKGIYIDSDVVVADDVATLFDTALGDHLIGACSDMSIQHIPPLVHYVEQGIGVPRLEYINSGVLLLNLSALRQADLEGHFLHLLTTYGVDCIAPDQDYLNAMCNGRILYLDGRWDAMPGEGKSLESPGIIHYNLFSKPWCYDGIQYADAFWQYAHESGYGDWLQEYKAAYSEEQKRADTACLQLLVERGSSIPDNRVTFKKLYESGVSIRL